jgi:succinoglycan biosynthesis protein ExoW
VQIISVIIPFFQREPNILHRALRSVRAQILPPGWRVDIIVVDDGSPAAPEQETGNLDFSPPFNLKIIRQQNGGAAAARNRGLEETDAAAALIAFLDSDDIWPECHLANAIEAHDRGCDFYFADNFRGPHHVSYFAECSPKTKKLIAARKNETGLAELPREDVPGLIVEEFPTQASTVVYSRDLQPDLRFNPDLRAAGEDMLFFVTLTAKARKICCNTVEKVECGGGVNIFFSNFDWDSPSYLKIKKDRVICHEMLSDITFLPDKAHLINKKILRKLRCDFVFHAMWRFFKDRGKIPAALRDMARSDPRFFVWSLSSAARIAILYPLGMYRP